jgi:AcrR family transcriptional regulator
VVSKTQKTALIKLRARSDDDKNARRDQLLRAALELWDTSRFSSFTMSDVATRAGLAKGTTYLYFKTKEELLLALLTRELEDWFNDLNAALEAKDRWSPKKLSRLVAESLRERITLRRLMVIQASILEHNITPETALEFKQFLLERATVTSTSLETRLSFLEPFDGVFVLKTLNALVIGLDQLSDPSAVAQKVLEQPGMNALKVDFETHLRQTLEAVLNGMKHRKGEST